MQKNLDKNGRQVTLIILANYPPKEVYCWIPRLIGIAGNENLGQKAKDSYNLHPTNFTLPYSNFKPFINRYIVNKWQILWNNSVGNKLFKFKPVIGQSQPVV